MITALIVTLFIVAPVAGIARLVSVARGASSSFDI